MATLHRTASGKSQSMATNQALQQSVAEDSLASVAPRVIELAVTVVEHSQRLERSFGIDIEVPESGIKPSSSNLMGQLIDTENALRIAAYALENVLRHVNG